MIPLIPTYIIAQNKKNKKKGTFCGTTFFVDISGFTPLTEQLMQHGTEGGGILSEILDYIFDPMVESVYNYGGIIPHFAGDAFTAIFEGNQTAVVAFIASEIQRRFDENPSVQTPFGDFKINIRIGLSYGLVDWGIVGTHIKTFYFKGSAIERATEAQKKAQPQQIIADKWFKEAVNHSGYTFQDIDNVFSILKNTLLNRAPFSQVLYEKLAAHQEDMGYHSLITSDFQPFLPQLSHFTFHTKGEFRDVVSIFLSFSIVSEFKDLEIVSSIVLKEFENYGGYFKEIDFSEKTGVLVGFFGAPTSYENNISRALKCTLAIRDALSNLPSAKPIQFRFGLTYGKAFTGIVGGKKRCQYAVVGDSVNLAARLMQNAEWGEVLVDKNMSIERSFDFFEKGNITYKGIAHQVPTFQLVKKHLEEKSLFSGKFFGREAELKQLEKFSSKLLHEKKGCFTTLFGEAGIGKSRLTYELRQIMHSSEDIVWASCPTDQILKKPFNPFLYFLKQFFQQNPEKSTEENRLTFENIFNTILENLLNDLPENHTEGAPPNDYSGSAQELMRIKSVLGALIGLGLTNSLWEQLDAKGRYDNTRAALESLFISLSFTNPVVIEVEDAHWLDEDSHFFLKNFCKKIQNKPIWIICSSRYDDEGAKTAVIETNFLANQGIDNCEIDLNTFSKNQLSDYALYILSQSSDSGGIARLHPKFLDILWRTTNGNPFYTEQILDYMLENELLQCIVHSASSSKEWIIKDPHFKVSNSISSLLMARVDRLSTILKETVKAAAVIGREFELPVLTEVMMAHEEYIQRNGNGKKVLREQVKDAEKGQIWSAMGELRYIFKHSLLREAVYDMQLKTRLRQQHVLIAQAIEKVYPNQREDRYIDLAFHYEQAGNTPKTIEYLKKASDFARRNFQNQQALDLFDRLLKNQKDKVYIINTLVDKGEVLQTIGQWDAAMLCFNDALSRISILNNPSLKGRVYNALGLLIMLKGNYTEAQLQLEKAVTCYEQVIDNQGIAKVYGNLGNLYFRQGEYEWAKEYFTKNISISRELNITTNPQIVSHLGLTYMNQGNYTEGVRCQEEELIICEKHKDLIGMSTIHVNLGIVLSEKGDYENALQTLEQGLTLAQKLGNKQLTSIALGCVGNVWLQKGNFEKAQDYLSQDLTMAEELGDKQGIGIACELFAKLYSARGYFDEAIEYYERSLVLCQGLHYQKGIAKSLHGLGEVYAFQCDFLKALDCFDRAIEISRKINNSLILGSCLTDKGNVLIKLGDISGARLLQTELKSTLDFSGNSMLFYYSKPFLNKM